MLSSVEPVGDLKYKFEVAARSKYVKEKDLNVITLFRIVAENA